MTNPVDRWSEVGGGLHLDGRTWRASDTSALYDAIRELIAAATPTPEPVGCFWCDYAKQHEGLVICATHGVHRPRFTLATQGKHLHLVDSGTNPARIIADLHLEADEANGFVTIANTGDTGQYDQNEPF